MRWWLLLALQVAPMLALPITHPRDWKGNGCDPNVEVLDFDFKRGSANFAVGPGLVTELTSPLVFDLQVQPVTDPRTSNISLNGQILDITWKQLPDPQPYYYVRYPITGRIKQTISLPDRSGVSHSVNLDISGWGDVHPKSPAPSAPEDAEQFIYITVEAVDGSVTDWTVALHSKPLSSGQGLLKLMEGFENLSQRNHLHREEGFLNASPLEQLTYIRHAEDDEFKIEEEIESLLLLEAEAGTLNAEVAARKQAIATCLKNHRDRASLRHLLQECDGIVCAAKVLAQRICDKVGILTEPSFHYAQVEDPRGQKLIQIDDDDKPLKIPGLEGEFQSLSDKPANGTLSGNRYFAPHTNSAAVTESITEVYPQSVLFRVLALIATTIGWTALCAFIRRKCMSARKQVDRLAEREKRRNARAYRRAARRADMRRRWGAFVATMSCFRAQPEPRIEDYEEKRALILQDAFMEQSIEAAEKGEVMEAEIRELRHANQIVASLVHAGPSRSALPPAMMARSRASTGTLPSYTSEMLPDYRSRYTRTELGSNTSSSVRSDSLVAASIDRYTITSSSEEAFTGSTPRSNSPESSSGRSRFTHTSSVLDFSPRPSAETLRTVTVGMKSRDLNEF